MSRAVHHGSRRRNRGFTLTELLVVVAAIVVLAIVALPAFNLIVGSSSQAVAQNQLAAALSRTRLEGMQRRNGQGLFLYYDRVRDRTVMVSVRRNEEANQVIELKPDTEPELLPRGIGLRGIGQNGNYLRYGLFVFDGGGSLESELFTIPSDGALARMIDPVAPPSLPQPADSGERTHRALAIYSAAGLQEADPSEDTAWTQLEANASTASARARWLNDNAGIFLINRYKGTLIESQ